MVLHILLWQIVSFNPVSEDTNHNGALHSTMANYHILPYVRPMCNAVYRTILAPDSATGHQYWIDPFSYIFICSPTNVCWYVLSPVSPSSSSCLLMWIPSVIFRIYVFFSYMCICVRINAFVWLCQFYLRLSSATTLIHAISMVPRLLLKVSA